MIAAWLAAMDFSSAARTLKRFKRGAPGQATTASMTVIGRPVGTMRLSRKSDAARRLRNSSSVRSLPPTVIISIWKSSILAAVGPGSSDTSISQTSRRPVRRKLLADETENGTAMLVAPVMYDVFQHIGIASVGDAFEEASALEINSAGIVVKAIGGHARDHLGRGRTARLASWYSGGSSVAASTAPVLHRYRRDA